MFPIAPSLVITTQDAERLHRVVELHLEGQRRAAAEALDRELARARLVAPPNVPPDVVTMNSLVLYLDEVTQKRREVVITYPRDARVEDGRVSILSPIGTALLGLSVGQGITWPMPSAGPKRLRVLAVPYQPEAAGNFQL
ncbi:nucleoside diphosphate kinase regulator [Polyangium jinanense]|uniref:Nucleoside diphosphate kinase regulator n=1 Tax=Polyangium jinanense TaxID=2829994 RepID=A0A9X3X6B7_9BACT|nr:nucleoside diphosphate kinase regulator [Polyangium jinanense]MDC3955784.1 nucleoside diphosphate kinase regulator [Polyangium jinanense]MDC3983143.1 nucleoside diphosphate kinase regulator [Polyangium jinanense]